MSGWFYRTEKRDGDGEGVISAYSVGYFRADGSWYEIANFAQEFLAAQRVHYLNGGNQPLAQGTTP